MCINSSVADPDPGSGIGCLFDPWIRDPGWEKVRIRIRDEQPGSYFLELRNHFFAFFGVKILKFFNADPGTGMETVRIRDGKKSDPGSTSRIRNTVRIIALFTYKMATMLSIVLYIQKIVTQEYGFGILDPRLWVRDPESRIHG